jgi:hypothetical protein
MSSYLDNYGVRDARREAIVKRLVLVVVALAVVGGALYWIFRDYREERQVKTFLELLRKKDYYAAYAMWGCTSEQPCPQYSLQNFMEDWGGDISSVHLEGKRSCAAGLIQTLRLRDEEIWLWVNRSDRVLSFAPWPVCNPHLPPGSTESPSG